MKDIERLRETILGKLPFETPRTQRASISYNKRLRTTGGRAVGHFNTVELNPHLLGDHPEWMEQVLAHELAHLVTHEKYGAGHGHGYRWKSVMRAMGYPPDLYHKMDTSKVQTRQRVKGIAKCACRPRIELKARKFNNIAYRGSKYRCRHCRQLLELIATKLIG